MRKCRIKVSGYFTAHLVKTFSVPHVHRGLPEVAVASAVSKAVRRTAHVFGGGGTTKCPPVAAASEAGGGPCHPVYTTLVQGNPPPMVAWVGGELGAARLPSRSPDGSPHTAQMRRPRPPGRGTVCTLGGGRGGRSCLQPLQGRPTREVLARTYVVSACTPLSPGNAGLECLEPS